MLRKIVIALVAAAFPALASAQTVQNYIVPTAPGGTSNNQAASTAFVQGAVGGGGSGFSGIINVKNPPFSAACDGTTDDTTAIQNAMNNAAGLFIPAGTCVVSNLIATQTTRISGNGPTSILQFKTGSTGYMLESNHFVLQVDHVQLNGGNVQDYNGVSSPGTRSGVHVWANVDNSQITNSVITGWNNLAVGLNGDANAVHNGTVVSNNQVSSNYCGIDTGPSGVNHDVCNGTSQTAGIDGAEYIKIIGNGLNKNRWAILVDSGNVNTVGNDIAHNGTCLFINGSPTSNPDHGNFVGNLCNHSGLLNSGQYAVQIHSGVGNGYIITNNNFFGGDWILNSPDGITISNNTIAVSNGANALGNGITMSGAGYINWANNWFTEISPIISDTSANTHWNNNFDQICQCFIKNQTALLVDPRGTSVATVLNVFGSNVVTDGTFTVNPGPWTLGAGMTINTGTNSLHGDGTSPFSLTFENVGATANQYYQVTFTIANYVSGTVNVGIGGAAANWPFFANGTYTIPAVFTQSNALDGNFYFVTGNFLGDIRNVQAKLVTFTSTLSVAQALTVPTIVANLPACNAGSEGSRAYVTDQNTGVAYRGAVTGSGTTRQAVLCSNSAWIQD